QQNTNSTRFCCRWLFLTLTTSTRNNMSDSSVTLPFLQTWLPGLRLLRTYDKRNFRGDLIAGVSVAAVAIPIGIAYSALAGSAPVVGIYSCLLPPIAYALFGSSRQLLV